MFAKSGFEDRPLRLNGIQIGRVGWKVLQLTPRPLNEGFGARRFVKRGVVEDDRLPGLQCGDETIADPAIKHTRVGVALKKEGGFDGFVIQCGNYAQPLSGFARNLFDDFVAAHGPTILPVQILVYPALIEVHQVFPVNMLNRI